MGYIYKITNNITNDFYIGKTIHNIELRFKGHLKQQKRNASNILYKNMKKYGVENYTIESLHQCDDSVLDEAEKKFISELQPKLNMTAGGDGGNTTGNKRWVTDGVKNKYINKTDELPDGYRFGRICIFNDPEKQKEFSNRANRELQGTSIKAAWAAGKFENRDYSNNHFRKNNPSKNPEQKELLKEFQLIRSKEIVTCPHCGKEGKNSVGMISFHFEKCKHNVKNSTI